MNATFSDEIEIFNYSRTLVVCTVTVTLVANLLTNSHVHQEYKFIRPAGSVYIYKNSLFL